MEKIKIVLFLLVLIIIKIIFYYSDKIFPWLDFKKHQSRRLGNVIDLWYTGSYFKSEKVIDELKTIDRGIFKDSFSRYLIENIEIKHKKLDEETSKILAKAAEDGAITYYYEYINICVNDFCEKLRRAMHNYDVLNNYKLSGQKFKNGNHCVIHYRLGDYVHYGDVLNFNDIIFEMKKLKIDFSAIEIMDGGKKHNSRDFFNSIYNIETKKSEIIYNQFVDKLRENFPETEIIKSTAISVDKDFYRMVYAPILITAGGSYAITAAMASHAHIIRTPSCKTLDFPSKGTIENLIINKKNCDWKTYQYSMLKDIGIENNYTKNNTSNMEDRKNTS